MEKKKGFSVDSAALMVAVTRGIVQSTGEAHCWLEKNPGNPCSARPVSHGFALILSLVLNANAEGLERRRGTLALFFVSSLLCVRINSFSVSFSTLFFCLFLFVVVVTVA